MSDDWDLREPIKEEIKKKKKKIEPPWVCQWQRIIYYSMWWVNHATLMSPNYMIQAFGDWTESNWDERSKENKIGGSMGGLEENRIDFYSHHCDGYGWQWQ